MRTVNKAFLYFIHSIFFMLEVVIVFKLASDYLFKFDININFELYITLCLLFFFLLFTLSDIYEYKKCINLLKNKVFILTSVLISIVTGVLIGYEQGLYACLFIIIFFIFIFINAVRINRSFYDKSLNSSTFLKLIRSFIYVIFWTPFYVKDTSVIAFGNRVIDFVNIYFIISILHIICVNLNTHIEASRAANKDKKQFLLNLLITLIIIVIVFVRNEIIALLDAINYYVSYYTDIFINEFITKLYAFIESISDSDFGNFLLKFMKRKAKEKIQEDTFLEDKEEIDKQDEEMIDNLDDLGIYKITYIVVLILILYISYRLFKKHRINRQSKGPEKKEFILKKEDIINDIKISFDSIFKKRENLSKERLIYKKTVNELIRDGYEISKITTPNEYISTIVDEDIAKYNFNKITTDYNTNRYGKS